MTTHIMQYCTVYNEYDTKYNKCTIKGVTMPILAREEAACVQTCVKVLGTNHTLPGETSATRDALPKLKKGRDGVVVVVVLKS